VTAAVLERGHGANRSRSDLATSRRSIETKLAVGDTSISVQSRFIELMFVRPGRGVWSFRAGDGGGLDQDGTRDGWVKIALASLVAYKGNPHPPATVEPGDRVFLIDPTELRAGDVEVGK
jgi:hypothetical protein